MKYRFLEKIATADAAFEAYGKDLEELFQNCALALMEVMVDTKTVKPMSNVKCQMPASPARLAKRAGGSNVKIEELLFDFLNELVFLKDSQQLLFSKFDIKLHFNTVQYYSKKSRLEATVWGEKIDPKKHKLRVDVKAVTWHLFKIEKVKKGWRAQVVVDI